MYARDDAERMKLIGAGWPWEVTALGIGLGAGGAFLALCALVVAYMVLGADGSGGSGDAMADPRGDQL